LPTFGQQVVVAEFGKRHAQQTQRTFARANLIVTDLLRTYYGETGAMDFGLDRALRSIAP